MKTNTQSKPAYGLGRRFTGEAMAPLAPNQELLPGEGFLRVDGLSYIGQDTALFHVIAPLASYRGTFRGHGRLLTICDARGFVFIAASSDAMHAKLLTAGFTIHPHLPVYFAHGETLVEPNPRGVIAADIASLITV